MLKLPDPKLTGATSVEEALHRRRSVREYTQEPLTLAEIGQLLWSAYGVSASDGKRTAPSAKELYPLRIYLVAGAVEGLDSGLYRYDAVNHALVQLRPGDLRAPLCEATYSQTSVAKGSAVIVFAGALAIAEGEFGSNGRQYVCMDLGHAGQNVHLQAVSLNLGTVVIGAFRPAGVQQALGLPEGECPLYLMPVGRI